MEKQNVSEVAHVELQKLRSRGIEPDDAEIYNICMLGERAQYGVEDSRLLRYCYQRVGKLKIYPLTLGAKIWLAYEAEKWWRGSDALMGVATVYAACNALNESKFVFRNRFTATCAMLAFGKTLVIGEGILLRALETVRDAVEIVPRVCGHCRKPEKIVTICGHCGEAYEPRREKEPSLIPYIGMMCHYFGETKEYWLWNSSEELCNKMLRRARRERWPDADIEDDPCLASYRELIRYVAALAEKRENDNGQQ